MTASIHPDHLRLLALAKASFKARDARILWRENPELAAEEHGFYCDALWSELERQVCEVDGAVPVLEHPSKKMRKMIANMRREIISTVHNAIEAAFDELGDGPMMDGDEG